MPSFRIAFLVQHARELDPQLDLAGTKLGNVEVVSDAAREHLVEELRPLLLESLQVNGYIPVVTVDIVAQDEDEALLKGFHQATLSLEPYSLIALEREAIDFSRQRPTVLPHALLIDEQVDPQTMSFCYHDGPRLLRVTVGVETLAVVQNFNRRVVRRIAELYPRSLLKTDAARSPLALRIGRAVHWYSQGEGQADPTMAFVCYWIGLEALVLKSSTSTGKKQTMVNRLVLVVKRHVSDSDWRSTVQDLWNKRSDIVHEGFGAAPAGLFPEIGAGEINEVKYLFFVALLYALDQHDKAGSLDDLWHPRNLDRYSPSATIDVQQFPIIMNALSLTRRRQRLAT